MSQSALAPAICMKEREKVWKTHGTFWTWWAAHPDFTRSRGGYGVGPQATVILTQGTKEYDQAIAKRDDEIFQKYSHLQHVWDALLRFVPY